MMNLCLTIPVERLNDLWMYNISSSQWTWLSGNVSVNANGVYGIMGLGSPNNFPGGRRDHAMTHDSRSNSIYVYGGHGYSQTSTSSES
jgi:hypothetical protein